MVMCYIDYDNLPPACRSIRLDKGVTSGLDYLHKILTQSQPRAYKRVFQSSPKVLVQNGQVHLTLNRSRAYKEWKVEDLAKSAGFKLLDSKPFILNECPMYRPMVGCGNHPNSRLKMRSPLTMMFEFEGGDDLEIDGDI